MAVSTCIYPLYEVDHGKYKTNKKPRKKKPIKDYLFRQGRFRHLPEEAVEDIQRLVDLDWKMLLNKEEHSISYEG